MKNLYLSIDINAPREEVWSAIISDKKYRLWTSVFQEGSRFEGGWQQGDKIKFVSEDDGHKMGMISEIEVSEHLKDISIHHLGMYMDGVEDYTSDHAKPWVDKYENYHFEKLDENGTRFTVELEVEDEFAEDFEKQWLLALQKLKAVCEEKSAAFASITTEAIVDAPLARVWDYWTIPEHVIKWNHASEDWYCPKAMNDLSVGGHFAYTMAAKDGSMCFDFSGTYTEIVNYERIINQLDDGRMMSVSFRAVDDNKTHMVETFEAEDENTLELQQGGWQAILDNFKSVVEREL
ncbi:MAG: uncharacterized protein K0S04_2113 [Herbinix sp.]|jgi:uncharacterized protein YndB with AHSA1/START domain|nr:uncharacterized protein [Herbinix sp.]